MSNELAVIEPTTQAIATVKPHRTRLAILTACGIPDRDPSKSLATVIKSYLKDVRGLKGADLNAEYLRILREDTAPLVAAKVATAIAAGWTQEIRTYNLDKKTGEETKFAVVYAMPKANKVKALSVSQQEALFESVGGKDTVQGKAMLAFLEKNGMLAKAKVTDVETTVTPIEEQPAQS